MNRLFISILIVLGFSLPLQASPDTNPTTRPTSSLAIDAQQRHDEALEFARSYYLKMVLAAERQEVQDLDKALTIVMQNKQLEEANRVNAIKIEAEKRQSEVQASMKKAPTTNTVRIEPSTNVIKGKSESPDWIAGTAWKFSDGKTIVRYRMGGVVEATDWRKPGTWVVTGPTSIDQTDPGTKVSITFSPDHHHAMWVYPSGYITWSTRID